MSMNLCFNTKAGNHFIDFPYQTPTTLTDAVLAAKTLEEKIELIRQNLNSHRTPGNTVDIDELFKKCEAMMRDTSLELDYI